MKVHVDSLKKLLELHAENSDGSPEIDLDIQPNKDSTDSSTLNAFFKGLTDNYSISIGKDGLENKHSLQCIVIKKWTF